MTDDLHHLPNCAHIWERRYDDQQNSKGYAICVSCGAWSELDDSENDEDYFS